MCHPHAVMDYATNAEWHTTPRPRASRDRWVAWPFPTSALGLHDGAMSRVPAASSSSRALILSSLLVLGACARSAPPPPTTIAACADGPPVCSVDRSAVVACQRGAWVMLQPCAAGCAPDVSGAPRCNVQAPAVSACAPEGSYGCTSDRRSLTICRGGRTAIASTCRGARGCTIGDAVDCDHSVAAVSDPCESTKEIACATDSRTLLRCNGATYQASETCRNACLSTSGRVLCQ